MHRLEFKSDDLVFSCMQYKKKMSFRVFLHICLNIFQQFVYDIIKLEKIFHAFL